MKTLVVSYNLGIADLYHLTNAGYLAAFIPKLKKKSRGIVVTVHDMIPFIYPRSPYDAFFRKAFKHVHSADMVIAASENTRRDILEYSNIEESRVKTIYYGVDHKTFRARDKPLARNSLGLPAGKPIILSVGSEEPRKNTATLIVAFDNVLRSMPETILLRVGERSKTIDKLIRNLGLREHIVYVKADSHEVAKYYNAADLLCFPSYYEGFGLPPLEAMASGCPVVTSNVASLPEFVGDCGIMVDPFDTQGLADEIVNLLSNRTLQETLATKGMAKAATFSWRRSALETLKVYRNIISPVSRLSTQE
jgi:glycosyltransferase involved in cell wall biosynthesis